MTVSFLGQKDIACADLHPHPENPNRGDVDQIVQSLKLYGQYRSVVANKDNTILAGHHVWMAANRMGLPSLRVDVVDADEHSARKILLADNRIADLGPGPDMEMLLDVLINIGNDLEGTGFDSDYVLMLEEMLAGAPDLDELEREAGGPPGDTDYLSRILLVVEKATEKAWIAYRRDYQNDTEALDSLLSWRAGMARPVDER